MTPEILVNTGSGNGLVFNVTEPSSEPMLTYYQWDPPAFILGLRLLEYSRYKSQAVLAIYTHGILATSSSGPFY